MGEVLLFDAARMKQIEDSTVVDGLVDTNGHLLLERRDGGTIDAGDIRAPNLADASTTVRGIVELATGAETAAGTDSERAVTPSGLTSLTANFARRGLVELASLSEALDGLDDERAITPAKLRYVLDEKIETQLTSLKNRVAYLEPRALKHTFADMVPITLAPGWVPYSQEPYTANGFMWPTSSKIDGIVQLTGLIIATGTPAAGSVVGYLPAGHWPDWDLPMIVNNSDTAKMIIIGADGVIRAGTGWLNGGYISLSSIKYPAAGVANWSYPAAQSSSAQLKMANNWVVYPAQPTWGPVRIWRDPITGLIWTGGVVSGGGWTQNQVIFQFGTETQWAAKSINHLITCTQHAIGGLYALPSGIGYLVTTGASTTYLSLNGVFYEPLNGPKMEWDYFKTYYNSWTRYPNYTEPGRLRSPGGLIYYQGFLQGGTLNTAAHFLRPNMRHGYGLTYGNGSLYPRVANSAIARLDLTGTGSLVPSGGSTTWFSLDALSYVATPI